MFNPNTRILIVDDMMTMRKLVAKSLKELGFSDLTEATDGANAWEKVAGASPPFGLIISDWNMPNSTGLDLLKRVRSDSRFGKTPFVLVTAEAEQHQIIEAAKAGVSNYVIKPFTTDGLRDKLEQVHKKIVSG
ncbi:MAG: response regulator [Proteobacteria bacterium]|nr:MAG: response regulator [Pseudomonadota bacterium]